MGWEKYLFKPSSLITVLLLIIVIILAVVASTQPDVNHNFYEIISSTIKVLVGALAGAVAGEKYTETGDTP